VALLVLIGTAGSQATTGVRFGIVADLVVAAVGALALGLLISSLVGTSEKAMALIAVLFVGEWLFSGAAVDLQGKPPLQAIGYLTSANWGFAAAASGSGLYQLEQRCQPGEAPLPGQPGPLPGPTCDKRWEAGPVRPAGNLLAAGVLVAGTAAATLAVLRRKDAQAGPRPARAMSSNHGPPRMR
jgi:ABC transport system ATP-binding/permease protein